MKTYDIGFLGGGQLARMSIQAAGRMGLTALSLDPGEVTPASLVAPAIQGSLSDPEAIRKILDRCEFVTLENEFIPAEAIRQAGTMSGRDIFRIVVPYVDTLATIQDKLAQKQALAQRVPTSRAWELVDHRSVAPGDYPVILKARFGGYDGKGTRLVRNPAELEECRDLWGNGGWMVEEFVDFKRELAVMVAVSDGSSIAFPTMETVQRNHVCDLVFPSDADGTQIAWEAVEEIDPNAQGLFGVELFEMADGRLLVNEIAPRPHNTGHYTLDWGGPSQFEAHIRAVTDMSQVIPLSTSFAVMANLLGQADANDFRAGVRAALEVKKTFVHWYGKAESKPGRKMGHINAVGWGEPLADVIQCVEAARRAFYDAWCR